MAKLPPNPLVSEVLRAAHGAKTVEKKVEVLLKYKRDDVKAILIWNFDKRLEVTYLRETFLTNLMMHPLELMEDTHV